MDGGKEEKLMKTIFFILFVHWIADFVLQTDKQAKGKSKNWSDLLSHTFSYSSVWISALAIWFLLNDIDKVSINTIGVFALVTFLAHTITDYFTSRLNSKFWQQGKTHQFFVSVGFDQILHYVQLVLTYEYIFNK